MGTKFLLTGEWDKLFALSKQNSSTESSMLLLSNLLNLTNSATHQLDVLITAFNNPSCDSNKKQSIIKSMEKLISEFHPQNQNEGANRKKYLAYYYYFRSSQLSTNEVDEKIKNLKKAKSLFLEIGNSKSAKSLDKYIDSLTETQKVPEPIPTNKNEIHSLIAEKDSLQNEIVGMERRCDEFQNKAVSLQSQISELNNQKGTLLLEVKNLKDEISKLEEKESSFNHAIMVAGSESSIVDTEKLQSKVIELEEENSNLKQEVETLRKKIEAYGSIKKPSFI